MENMTTDYQGFKRDTDLAVEKIRTGAMTMAQGAVELGYQLKVARDTGVLRNPATAQWENLPVQNMDSARIRRRDTYSSMINIQRMDIPED